MGLFKSAKRAVKKITKPVARVLNKVVPNELKPFLPYAAAFVPFAAPASFGIGSLSPMVSRALLSGGANLASQLAQEGNEEGDFSGLSALLAAGTGYLSTPGAADQLRGMTAAGQTDKAGILKQLEAAPVGTSTGSSGFLGSAKDFVLNTGAKAAEALNVSGEGIGSILAPGGTPAGFNMETLSAASVPFTQGSIDLGIATARKALRDYELELDAFNAQAGANQAASDADRRSAIIASMTRADFTQDIIDETLDQLGLKDGGIARLGFDNGGDVSFGGIKEAIKDVAQNNMEEGVTQMYVSDSAGVIPLKAGDAVTGKTMDMMVSGFIEPYGKNDFRDPDGYERFMDVFSEFKETKMKKDEELNADGMKKGGLASYKDGGIMNLGGKEMDMRTGGFIPIGAKERADDVPARLSKNEFVMTADAVRAAGGGSVNQGAKRMYDLMHNLEARA